MRQRGSLRCSSQCTSRSAKGSGPEVARSSGAMSATPPWSVSTIRSARSRTSATSPPTPSRTESGCSSAMWVATWRCARTPGSSVLPSTTTTRRHRPSATLPMITSSTSSRACTTPQGDHGRVGHRDGDPDVGGAGGVMGETHVCGDGRGALVRAGRGVGGRGPDGGDVGPEGERSAPAAAEGGAGAFCGFGDGPHQGSHASNISRRNRFPYRSGVSGSDAGAARGRGRDYPRRPT